MRVLSKDLLLIAGVLMAAGCGSVATKKSTEVGIEEAIQQESLVGAGQWTAGADSGEVQAGWVKTFDDPMLTAFVVEAQKNNRSLAVAAANVDRSWALARRAGSALMPDANIIALGSRSGTTTDSATADAFTAVSPPTGRQHVQYSMRCSCVMKWPPSSGCISKNWYC